MVSQFPKVIHKPQLITKLKRLLEKETIQETLAEESKELRITQVDKVKSPNTLQWNLERNIEHQALKGNRKRPLATPKKIKQIPLKVKKQYKEINGEKIL